MATPSGHEPLTTASADLAGLSANDLGRMVTAGELKRPFRGVYLPPGTSEDAAQRARALAVLLPPGAALARETAAWVHGIDVRPPERHRDLPWVECVSPSDDYRNPVRRHEVRSYLAELPASDVVDVGGVPVTTPERTAMDLARYAERYMGLAAVDMFAHAGLVTIEALAERVRTLRGFRGIARARSVLRLADPRTESAGESWCRLRLWEAGLPRPVVQLPLIDGRGRIAYRLDMAYPEHQVAVEYDGIEYHFATSDHVRNDDARDQRIRREWGWHVLHFHAGHVLGTRPLLEEAVIAALELDVTPARQRWRRGS